MSPGKITAIYYVVLTTVVVLNGISGCTMDSAAGASRLLPAPERATESEPGDTTAQAKLPSAAPAAIAVTNVACDAETRQVAEAMLAEINSARSQARRCGAQSFDAAAPLSLDDTLETAARAHTNDMVEQNFFSHTGSDGLNAADRITRSGYRWSAIGENIAAGQTTTTHAINDWLDSNGHCVNLMNPDYSDMAVACRADPTTDFSAYWTVVFAHPR